MIRHTKTRVRVARAIILFPKATLSRGTMRIRDVLVTHALEEVDLIFPRKEGRADGVDRCVTPALH